VVCHMQGVFALSNVPFVRAYHTECIKMSKQKFESMYGIQNPQDKLTDITYMVDIYVQFITGQLCRIS